MYTILTSKCVGAFLKKSTKKMGIFGQKSAQKRAQKYAIELLDLQTEKQKELNEHLGAQNWEYEQQSAQLNYDLGQQAADAQQQRNIDFYNLQQETEGLTAQFNEAQELGLNPLAFTGGGAGGGGGAGSGSTQGGNQGNQRGEVPEYLGILNAMTEAERAETERKLATAQIAQIGADTANTIADTRLKNEERKSSVERSPIENELLKQEGIAKFIENTKERWNLASDTVEKDDVWGAWNDQAGVVQITKGSHFNQQQAAEVAKAWSETNNNNAAAELNTEKRKGYWQELINATKNADAEEAKAAAVKLAADFNYGEYTNWKYWTKIAGEGINGIINLIK